MTKVDRVALVCAAALLGVVCLAGRATGQELSKEATDKAAAEARAKRNAQTFELNATTIVFYDRTGKRTGGLGERAIYGGAVISPDGSRVAVVKTDLPNESADVFVLDIATGASMRMTTSARTEFVLAPIWSPDSNRIAYVTMRKGQEGIYVRPANGQGAEEVVCRNPGAFMDLSDWSTDGRLLTLRFPTCRAARSTRCRSTAVPIGKRPRSSRRNCVVRSALLTRRPLPGVHHLDKTNKGEMFVRPADPKAEGGPWQVSDGAIGSRSGGATARRSISLRATDP